MDPRLCPLPSAYVPVSPTLLKAPAALTNVPVEFAPSTSGASVRPSWQARQSCDSSCRSSFGNGPPEPRGTVVDGAPPVMLCASL